MDRAVPARTLADHQRVFDRIWRQNFLRLIICFIFLLIRQ